MIKSVSFKNFRNLNNKSYSFNSNFNLIIGKNNSGKTNILDGIRIAFSSFDGNYVKIQKSDFSDSDDSRMIEIYVELEYNSIPSFNAVDGTTCGFKVEIQKTGRGFYKKNFYNYDGTNVSADVVTNDDSILSLYKMPMVRIEDIYSYGAIVDLATFIDSEEKYSGLRAEFRESTKKQLDDKIKAFQKLCKQFGHEFDIEANDPKIGSEKLYIVDGDREHGKNIGSGYKSIANIILCSMSSSKSVVLIDEIENHIHPALLRSLINNLRSKYKNLFVIATSHSPVAINEIEIENVIDAECGNISGLLDDRECIDKLNTFLHPGRAELMLADNIVVVEGTSEEIILRKHIASNDKNITVVNAMGIMFEPYLTLAKVLKKKVIAISDNDRSQSDNGSGPSPRFNNLKAFCGEKDICIIEVNNTLETDLFNTGIISGDEFSSYLKPHEKHGDIMIAKSGKKNVIASEIASNSVDLSRWHVIKEIEEYFAGSN